MSITKGTTVNKNSKTTIWGIIAAIGAAVGVVAPQLQLVFDGDAATNPDWQVVIGAGVAVLALFGIGKAAADAPKNPEKP